MQLTDQAIAHFSQLLIKENVANLRITVKYPQTPQAEVEITFCPEQKQLKSDTPLQCENFILFIDKMAIEPLQDAVIDYKLDDFGGHIAIKAPNLKGEAPLVPAVNAPLKERIAYTIHNEINPNLASHGGFVDLVNITDNGVVVLRFGGGCHGCGMVNVTLKNSIESALKSKFPEITGVEDVTNHSTGENPYYS